MTHYTEKSRSQSEKIVEIAYKLSNLGHKALSARLLAIGHDIRASTILGSWPDRDVFSATRAFLTGLKIDFAAIGGIAVAVHGHPRGTDDIDLLVDRLPPADKLRDRDYMKKFGFYPAKSRTYTVLTLDHQKGQVELLVAKSPLEKEALASAQNSSEVGLPVVSAAALICLKIRSASSNPKREAKDLPDALAVWAASKPDLSKFLTHLSESERQKLKNLIG